MNYFQEFLDMIDSGHLNDFIEVAPGSEKAEEAISEINKLIKQDEVLRDKIAYCITLHQELWFNVGWSAGWKAGAATIAKFAGLDSPGINKIAKTVNFDSD
jgi:hypothetical protein